MSIELKSIIKKLITGCLWGTIGLFVKLMEGEASSASYTSFLRLFFGALLLGVVCQGTFNILYSMSVSMNE